MSTDPDTETDAPSVLTKTYRSVSPRYRSHADAEMVVIVRVLEKLVGAVADRRGSD